MAAPSRRPPITAMVLCTLAWISLSNLLGSVSAHAAPSGQSAKDNAAPIFNAIDSAGRQWGSAIFHNGLSFFPATVPRGTLLYHGRQSSTPPPALDWLAFEVEHAEGFAFSWKNGSRWHHWPPEKRYPSPPTGNPKQKPLSSSAGEGENPRGHDGDEKPDAYLRGYLHTYRANRDLKLLYIDGMSAGKTTMGTLDTQRLILLEKKPLPPGGNPLSNEIEDAEKNCQLVQQWGYDGLIRMEIGFEVIWCDFEQGLDLISAKRTPFNPNNNEIPVPGMNSKMFQWSRAVAERYDGVGGGRIRLDFSSMMSAYFFPINITNPDPKRPDLPRLTSADPEALRDVKDHLHRVSTRPPSFTVNWQAVTDMITTRYAKRLALLASPGQPFAVFATEIQAATGTYFNEPSHPGDVSLLLQDAEHNNETANAVHACHQHYLLPTYLDRHLWSEQDHLIHTAIETVLTDICTTLFRAKTIIREKDDDNDASGDLNNDQQHGTSASRTERLKKARHLMQQLQHRLGWSVWKRPQVCAVDEVLLTVMWPSGSEEDYWNPGCRTYEEINVGRSGYWRPDLRDPK